MDSMVVDGGTFFLGRFDDDAVYETGSVTSWVKFNAFLERLLLFLRPPWWPDDNHDDGNMV